MAGITESIAKGSTRSKLDVDLPADLAKKGEKAQKELASKAGELESKAKQSIESTQKRTGDALAKLSPKELREKVSQTKEKGDEAIADLELPTEFGETPSRAPAKTDQARPIANEKSSLPKSPSKSTPRPEDLPPVKTTDVSRVREGATKSKLPTPASKASKADDEFGSLDLPSDLTGSSPSSLSPSSGSGPVGSKASRLKEDLPKPLPDADRVGMPPDRVRHQAGLRSIPTSSGSSKRAATSFAKGNRFERSPSISTRMKRRWPTSSRPTKEPCDRPTTSSRA